MLHRRGAARDHPQRCTRSRRSPREPHATARVFRFADGQGEIGFINPVSEPFCADCNRIRLTADGKLRTCLFSLHETDLREPLRGGRVRRRARDGDPRRRLAQGAQAPGRRAGLPPAAADDVRDRWLAALHGHRAQRREGAQAAPRERSTTRSRRSSGSAGELADGASARARGRHADPAARAGAAGGRPDRAGRARAGCAPAWTCAATARARRFTGRRAAHARRAAPRRVRLRRAARGCSA